MKSLNFLIHEQKQTHKKLLLLYITTTFYFITSAITKCCKAVDANALNAYPINK